MRGFRTGSRTLTKLGLVLAASIIAIVLLLSGTALAAPPWPDAPNAWWISTYGVTESQAATVADGGQDGYFRPNANITRAQFAKMAVSGLGVGTAYPPIATFPDVPLTHFFSPWIEGGAAANLIAGQVDGSFGPDNTIIRQQANSILGKYLAQKELTLRGHIAGREGNYPSLNTWYLAEGVTLLSQFADAGRVASVHAPATAYLVYRGVVQGSSAGGGLYIGPGLDLTRAQAVALILRVKAVTFSTALPTITTLNPSSGLPSGGNTVIITGTNFTEVFSVKFGAVNATFTVNSATQITATAPAGTVGTTVDVKVETAAGTSVPNAASKYTYGLPTVTALNPGAGPGAGGNTVVITGTNLTGATAVKFGTKNATSFTVNSSTQITAVAPSGTGTVDVTVTTPGGTTATSAASKYSYGAPTVSGLTPTSGPAVGGNSVVITGTGFSGVTAVKFGAKTATFVINSPTSITATAPSGTVGSTVDVTVTTSAGTSTAGLGTKYYYGGPVITLLTPNAGPAAGGNTVIITGTGFTSVTSVMFGNKRATTFTVNSATKITAVAPSGSVGSVVDVKVTTAAGTSEDSEFTKYTYGLAVTDVVPNHGPALGGNTVVIYGAGFGVATSVDFGGVTILPVNFDVKASGTQIWLKAPPGTGKVDIRVNVGALKSANTTADDYYYTPVITMLSPDRGAISGGNLIHVYGAGFTGATAVRFGGVSGSDFHVVSDTEITVRPPAHLAGGAVPVVVIGKYDVSNTMIYTYGGPVVSSLSPSYGPAAGGTAVTINGSGFTGATKVTFGGTAFTAGFSVNGAGTQITGIVSPGGTGVVDVIVTAFGVDSANTTADNFRYGPDVTSVSPPSGAVGATVTINGTNLFGATSVTFDGTPAVAGWVVNGTGTAITGVVVPAGSGQADVAVTTPGGSDTLVNGFTYTAPAVPTVTGISPDKGPTWGGQKVTITGTNFTGASAVLVAGVAVTGFSVLNATTIEAYTHLVPGPFTDDVSVTVGVNTGTLADAYTYGVLGVTGLQYRTDAGDGVTFGAWTDAPASLNLPNGQLVDFRVRVTLDGLAWTNALVQVWHPFYHWQGPGPTLGGRVPEAAWAAGAEAPSFTTDAGGYLYWYYEGGQANSTWDLNFGFDLDNGGDVEAGEPWTSTFTGIWGP